MTPPGDSTPWSRAVELIVCERPRTELQLATTEMLLRRIDGVMRIRDSKLLMFQAPRGSVADVLRLLPDAEPATSYAVDGGDLLAMQALGPDSADTAHMIALGDTIRALRRAGLEADARRLGLEALDVAVGPCAHRAVCK